MKENNLILKNSAILFVRLIVTSLFGLFSIRLLVNCLGASNFGLYNVVGGIVVVMAFLNTIMISTTFRFLAFEMGKDNHQGLNKVFNISLVIHLMMVAVVIILTETVGVFYINNYLNIESGKLSDALFVLRLSTYATVFTIISIPYQGLLTANEKFLVQAAIEIVKAVLALIAVLLIYIFTGNKLRNYAILMLFVSIVPAILFITYCKRNYPSITKWSFQYDKSKYKEMIGFSGWIMFGAAASVGKTQGSALIINSFFGTVVNASFGVARQLDSLVRMFAANLGQAVVPQITKSHSSGNSERTIKLVAYSTKYTFFLMLIPAIPILLETEYLIKLWLTLIPPFTIIFCQLMIINALIDCFVGGMPALTQASGKIKYFQIILSITSLSSLPIAYFFFNAGYSPSFLLVAYISTAFLNVFLSLILIKKTINFDIRYFVKTAYLKIFYVIILILPVFFLKNYFSSGIGRFLIFSIFSLCWLFIIIYAVGIDKGERNKIKQIFISQFQKIFYLVKK